MKTTVAFRSAATLLFSVLGLTAQAEPVSVLGPLEAVSADGKSITVLGQTYRTDSKEVSRTSLRANGIADGYLTPSIGTYVVVQGERSSAGDQVAVSVRTLPSSYVPGATDIYLVGVAAKYDATVAIAEIGSLRVYLGDIDGASLAQSQGALLEIVGRQSQAGGLVWATAARIVRPSLLATNNDRNDGADVSAQSITGTGKSTQSITGTGVSTQSITGTGKSTQSITGTGVSTQSITGTGKSTQSITGTGVSAQSITGTGKSTQSITGTGVSAQSITGTGKSTQSITGTGVSAQSITGTGVSVQSITGTGKSTQSITGTGVSVQSITGTGKSTQSITGTGVSVQSITGTGKSTQSITGTGVSVQSITGTGMSAQSITGTGVSMQSITGTGRAS